jgi:protein-disulfide isomerase
MKLDKLFAMLLPDRVVVAGTELRFRFRRGRDGGLGLVKSMRLTNDPATAGSGMFSIVPAGSASQVMLVAEQFTGDGETKAVQRSATLDVFPSAAAARRAKGRLAGALLHKEASFPTWAKGVLMCCMALGTLTIMAAVSRQIHPMFQTAAAPGAQSAALPANEAPLPKLSDVRALHYGPNRNEPKLTVKVFMDPLCPACGAFNKEIAELAASGVDVYVVPVTIVNAKSRDVLSTVLCAEQPETAWNAVVDMHNALGDQMSVKACNAGLDAADVNTALFHGLGLKVTPTIILPNNQRIEQVLKASDVLKRLQAS